MARHSVSAGAHSLQHNFALMPDVKMPRSKFDMSFGHKTTFDEGDLIPVLTFEVVPGDTLSVSMTALARMATPIYPIMDNMYLESHFFFVPNRLVWTNWAAFCGEQPSTPSDSTDFILPTVTAPAMGGVATGDLADYMGLPIKVNSLEFQSLPLRCYNLIWNQWYRDENLQDAVTVEVDNGPDTYANYAVLRRGKRHDYFTSCLPWTQKINDGTTINVPLAGTAPIVGIGTATGLFPSTGVPVTETGGGSATYAYAQGFAVSSQEYIHGTAASSGSPLIYANLSEASGATINQLRQAFQLQVLFERDARGGTRYAEILRAHYGVLDPLDAVLQRPQFLGGGSQMISINPVTQNAPPTSTDDTPQGNLAAFGVVSVNGHGFTHSFTEHGYVIGILSVCGDLNYQQGMHRMWSRSTRYDFYWPALAHIGEQAVLNQEIYAQGSSADTMVFGYNERHAEYRFMQGQISGLFRSTATTPLDSWHIAQKFTTLPTLGSTFIQENAPMSRIEAVTDQPDFIADIFFKIHAARVMPLFGVPTSLDRF